MTLSIITINRNNFIGLEQTIKSVISQTFTTFEFIIIDGNSTDDSIKIIHKYSNRINYWISEPDNGIYNAMNKGIRYAHGEYFLFLNSGDWLYSNTILSDVFSLGYKEDILYGNAIGKNGVIEVFPNKLSAYFFYASALCHQSVFFKRDLFLSNLYDEQYKFVSDWDFLLSAIVFKNKSYQKIELIIVGQQDGICYNGDEAKKERAWLIKKRFHPLIIEDFKTIRKVESQPLQEYMDILENDIRLRRFVKRIIKIYLFIMKRKQIN